MSALGRRPRRHLQSRGSMTIVTNEMISAAHGVTMKRGIVLSWEILQDIYLSMDALANHEKTSGSPCPNCEALARAVMMDQTGSA